MSENVHVGLNATADSFYSTQGRTDLMFNDKNENIISSIKEKYPDIMTLEMETFMVTIQFISCNFFSSFYISQDVVRNR